MSRTTKRFDQSISLSARSTSATVRAQFDQVMDRFGQLETEGWDLNWANLEINSDLKFLDVRSIMDQSVEEYTTIRFTLRGRM